MIVAQEGLFSALAAGAPLQDLRLEIDLYGVDSRPQACRTRDIMMRSRRWQHGDPVRPLPDLNEHPLNIAEQSVVSFDSRDYVRRFTASVPTLQRVRIHFAGLRFRRRTVSLVDGEIQIEGSW